MKEKRARHPSIRSSFSWELNHASRETYNECHCLLATYSSLQTNSDPTQQCPRPSCPANDQRHVPVHSTESKGNQEPKNVRDQPPKQTGRNGFPLKTYSLPAPTGYEEQRPLCRHIPGHHLGNSTSGVGPSPRSRQHPPPLSQSLNPNSETPPPNPPLHTVDADTHDPEAGCSRSTARCCNCTGLSTPGRWKRRPCRSDHIRGGSRGQQRGLFGVAF